MGRKLKFKSAPQDDSEAEALFNSIPVNENLAAENREEWEGGGWSCFSLIDVYYSYKGEPDGYGYCICKRTDKIIRWFKKLIKR